MKVTRSKQKDGHFYQNPIVNPIPYWIPLIETLHLQEHGLSITLVFVVPTFGLVELVEKTSLSVHNTVVFDYNFFKDFLIIFYSFITFDLNSIL